MTITDNAVHCLDGLAVSKIRLEDYPSKTPKHTSRESATRTFHLRARAQLTTWGPANAVTGPSFPATKWTTRSYSTCVQVTTSPLCRWPSRGTMTACCTIALSPSSLSLGNSPLTSAVHRKMLFRLVPPPPSYRPRTGTGADRTPSGRGKSGEKRGGGGEKTVAPRISE